MTYSAASPVFAPTRMGPSVFRLALFLHGSPAHTEAAAIYTALVSAGIDPAIALGQFAAESSFGTKGYATATRNWGNLTIRHPALPHWTRAYGGQPWLAPNGRTYVKFPTWTAGVRAYAALLATYRSRGWATSVAAMAGHWLGMADASRSGYVRNIVSIANAVAGQADELPPPPPPPVSASTIARLRRYIANLSAVKRPTSAVTRKLAAYRARLTDYLGRGK